MFKCVECLTFSPKADLIVVPKNVNAIKQWNSLYNLSLNLINTNRNVQSYVCKSHISETKPDPETLLASSSEPLLMEVKQEEISEDDGQMFGNWNSNGNKSTTEEVNYDEFPFVKEENSYGDFEDGNNYTHEDYNVDCQPTTSSAMNSSHHVPRIDNLANFNNLPVHIPELSDNEILSFCVKTSSNLSGFCSFECGMCPEVFFNYTDTRPIRHHLNIRHYKIIKTFLETGRALRAPKIYAPMASSAKMRADLSLCKFLIKNGMSLRAVQDRNLEMLAFNMNSEYTLPTIDTLYELMNEIANSRKNTIINTDGGAITVTFDTTSFNNSHFLAFTVHFYDRDDQKKRRALFLRELQSAQPSAQSVISTIRNAVEDCDQKLRITTIVTGNPEFEDGLEEMQCFKQVMVCFSQNVNKFAEALIGDEVFASPLRKLREFITKFPQNREAWGRFKAYIVKKRTYGEYPEIDNGHWCTTLDFITKCLHMHRLFSEFISSFPNNFVYISVEDNVNIVYLHSLLNLCKSTLKMMVDTNSTIADVIPAIDEINNSLNVTTSRPSVITAVNIMFARMLLPFVEQSDVHRFALFLHPLRHSSAILPRHEWDAIQASIARQLSLRISDKKLRTSLSGENSRSSIRDEKAVDKEVTEYAALVSRTNGIDCGVMEWWDRHAQRFPMLYEYAMELFQIPAFSIDAAFYLGDYGFMTYSLNDIEVSKRKLLLQASSELVEYRSKGAAMHKAICVKRKRETGCQDDLWYTPLDPRSLRPHENLGANTGRMGPMNMASASLSSRMDRANIRIEATSRKVNKNLTNPGSGRGTLKQEIERMEAMMPPKVKPGPRIYHIAQQPTIVKREVTDPVCYTMPPAKKIYAVRPVQPNGVQPNPGASRVVQVRRPIIRSFAPTPTMPSTSTNPARKLYFVRPKTGAIHQNQQPPN